MKTLPLILRIVAIIAAVVAATLFFMAKGKLSEKQTQLTQTQQTLQATQGDLTDAQSEKTRLENRLSAESEALADSKRELESIRSEMYTARQEVSRTRKKLSQTRSEITELKETTRKLRSDLVEAEQMVAQEEGDDAQVADLRARIRELESARENLQTELQIAKTRNSAPQTSGETAPSGAVAKGFAGSDELSRLSAETEVKSISPENGLIVLRANPEFELAAGQKVSLISNLKSLATVEIADVKNSLAVANILPGANTSSLEPGSKVQLFR